MDHQLIILRVPAPSTQDEERDGHGVFASPSPRRACVLPSDPELAPAPGFEPGTARLTVGSSAVELRRITSTFANTVHTFREQPDEDSNSGSGHRNRPAVTGESHQTRLNPKGCSKRGKRRIDPLPNLRVRRVDSGVEHDRPAKVRLPRHSSCHQARTPITIYGHMMLHND